MDKTPPNQLTLIDKRIRHKTKDISISIYPIRNFSSHAVRDIFVHNGVESSFSLKKHKYLGHKKVIPFKEQRHLN